MSELKKQNGFTLIELIMLIIVLSIVGLTMGGTFLHMIRISTNSFLIKKASITAHNYIEDFHAYKANSSSDTWEQYLIDNFSGTETVDNFTVTLSWNNATETISGYNEDVEVYRYTVVVDHANLSNAITIENAFTIRQFE